MKRVIWRPYWNYEKEEKWLNEMAARGWLFTDYSWCRYVFQEGREGEFVYRIELLENLPTHPESQKYLRFLEGTGIECVASYLKWVYLRKKSADGPFDIYTDLESRIAHHRRILKYWRFFTWLELIVGFINLTLVIIVWFDEGFLSNNLWMGILLIAFGFMFAAIGAPVKKQLKRWIKEKQIRES